MTLAGKTTLMRILTGLSFPTEGTYSLFGKESREQMKEIRRRIGSTIEEPTLYPEFSAYRNLELQRVLLGNPDKAVCGELLKLLDLYDVRDKKVKEFSMGMKQRLGVALALIGKPELLILDEPVNGLDPKNISALRELLKKLNEERGITMLISSHILNELYLLATDYIIIHRGIAAFISCCPERLWYACLLSCSMSSMGGSISAEVNGKNLSIKVTLNSAIKEN